MRYFFLEKPERSKMKTSNKAMVDFGREAFTTLSSSAGVLASNFLKRFRNPVVASKSYRYLARQIFQDLVTVKGGKSIVFTSATNMDISNEILLMFAHFLQDELLCSVLIVDATFRNSGVTKLLSLGDRPGIIDMLSLNNEHKLTEAVTQLSRKNISFVAAGNVERQQIPNISEDQARTLIKTFTKEYDYVILQQDNIQVDTRYLPFAKAADMILLHLEERNTTIASFDQAKEVFIDHQIVNVKYLLSER